MQLEGLRGLGSHLQHQMLPNTAPEHSHLTFPANYAAQVQDIPLPKKSPASSKGAADLLDLSKSVPDTTALSQLQALRDMQLQQLQAQYLYGAGQNFNMVPQNQFPTPLLPQQPLLNPNFMLFNPQLYQMMAQDCTKNIQSPDQKRKLSPTAHDPILKKAKLYSPLLNLCESTNLVNSIRAPELHLPNLPKVKSDAAKKRKTKPKKAASGKPKSTRTASGGRRDSTVAHHSSNFKGVHWNKACKAWRAQISVRGKTEHLGNFDNEAEAAREYDRRATELGRGGLNFDAKDSVIPADISTKRRRDRKRTNRLGSVSSQTSQPDQKSTL